MEKNQKRLCVFQAITRGLSPDTQIPPIPEETDFPPNKSPSKESYFSLYTESLSNQVFSNSSIPKLQKPLNSLSIHPSPSFSKVPKEPQPIQNPDQKMLSSPFPKRISAFCTPKYRNYENSLNTSGSFSNRSFTMNISTEESSKEEYEERRKPKKRPLEEGEKNFYVIRLENINSGKDRRTTVMIKNIPNKYSQQMLLQTIDHKFAGTYDFLYLPIDFKVNYI